MMREILSLALSALGTILFVHTIFKLRAASQAKRWKVTSIKVKNSEIQEIETLGYYGRLISYAPRVDYSYVVSNRMFDNNVVSIDRKSAESFDKSEVFGFLNKLEMDPIAYYNPTDPSEAVLLPRPSKKRISHFLALIVSGTVLAVIGIAAAVFL